MLLFDITRVLKEMEELWAALQTIKRSIDK